MQFTCIQYYPSSFYKYLQETSTWCDWDKYGNNFCPHGRASIISFLSSRRRRNARGRITDKRYELSSPDRTSSSSTPYRRRRRFREIGRARQLQLRFSWAIRAQLNRETRAFLLFSSPRVAQLQTARINLATSTVRDAWIGREIYRATERKFISPLRKPTCQAGLVLRLIDARTENETHIPKQRIAQTISIPHLLQTENSRLRIKKTKSLPGRLADKLSRGRNDRHSANRYFYLLTWHIALYQIYLSSFSFFPRCEVLG